MIFCILYEIKAREIVISMLGVCMNSINVVLSIKYVIFSI